MEVTITNENFKDYLNGELPLVVDLWATWCGPCRALAPIVSELAEEYDGRLVGASVTSRNTMTSLPTMACAIYLPSSSSRVANW